MKQTFRTKWLGALVLGLVTCSALAGPASAEAKRAFVVGVGDYEDLPDLQKTVSDAGGYSKVFRDDLGFDVTTLINPDRYEFIVAFDTFLRSIAPGDEIAFIFSGHGWSDGAENYLALSDAPESAPEAVVRADTIALKSFVLAELRARKPRLNLAIVDACRDNPFDTLTMSAAPKGLARISADEGELILYSAGAAQQSLDRLADSDPSTYSVFTRVLLPKLSHADRPLAQIADETRSEVQTLAAGVGHAQRPEMMLGISLGFCLSGQCQAGSGAENGAGSRARYGLDLDSEWILDQSQIMNVAAVKADANGLWLAGNSLPIGTLPSYPAVARLSPEGDTVAFGLLAEPDTSTEAYQALTESKVRDVVAKDENSLTLLVSSYYIFHPTRSALEEISLAGNRLQRRFREIDAGFNIGAVAPSGSGYLAFGVEDDSENADVTAYAARLGADLKPLWKLPLRKIDAYQPQKLVLDADGGLWVLGTLPEGADGTQQAWIARIDPNGRLLWEKAIPATASETGAALAADPSGGVWVTGTRTTGTEAAPDQQIWVRRISASGEILWTANAGGGRLNRATDIIYDARRNIAWVSGTAATGHVMRNQARIYGIDPSGNIVAQALYGSIENETAADIELDPNGNIYTAGGHSSAADEWAPQVPYIVHALVR